MRILIEADKVRSIVSEEIVTVSEVEDLSERLDDGYFLGIVGSEGLDGIGYKVEYDDGSMYLATLASEPSDYGEGLSECEFYDGSRVTGVYQGIEISEEELKKNAKHYENSTSKYPRLGDWEEV